MYRKNEYDKIRGDINCNLMYVILTSKGHERAYVKLTLPYFTYVVNAFNFIIDKRNQYTMTVEAVSNSVLMCI